MTHSALGLLRQGLENLRGFPGYNLLDQNSGQNGVAGQTGHGFPKTHPVSPIDDQVDVPENLLSNENPRDAALTSGSLSPKEVIQRTLSNALDSIVGTLAEVFERLGNGKDAALDLAKNLVNSIKEGAANSDEFSFSFEQSVATRTQKSLSYAGADGVASGVSEQTYLAVQSLDIYVNNNTGELSFNFASVQAEITKTTAVAQSSSAEGANSLLGNVLQGLDTGGFYGAGEALALAREGVGLDELINTIVSNPPRTNADDDAELLRKLPGEGPLLSLREKQDIRPEKEGDDPFTVYRADLLVPLGHLFNGANGPEFEGRDGVRQSLLDTLTSSAGGVGVDA
ncbi:hypothetical protein [Kiloniella antarctica]|uniref:DUF5610 domain-containing protein n=1 Tax=Kiloniella antarctica TaxID=1550907 RepID=A0ABW5BJE0_9PROT